jgi:hypothetical protein
VSILAGVICAMILGVLAGIVIGFVKSRRAAKADDRSTLPREPR